jgi:hypothetical protein
VEGAAARAPVEPVPILMTGEAEGRKSEPAPVDTVTQRRGVRPGLLPHPVMVPWGLDTPGKGTRVATTPPFRGRQTKPQTPAGWAWAEARAGSRTKRLPWPGQDSQAGGPTPARPAPRPLSAWACDGRKVNR